MAEVIFNNVYKVYDGGVKAVNELSLKVDNGEFLVLVGPSGCGKTTALRMVAGLESITSGQIEIGDRVVNDVSSKDRDVAMVFQNYALYPHMSVYDNMAYGLRIRKLSDADIEARVQKAAKILELGALLQRKPRELSGGQRQRVAMGRAIVREPAAFLFDEPLSNLDAKLRVQMRLEIQKLHRELKTTSIFVTHDQVEAMTLADRMIVMNAGRAEQIGAPMEVYDNPASIFVAGFIGSPAMNFLPGRVKGAVLEIGDGLSMPIPVSMKEKMPEGAAITFGIRPEHLQIGDSGLPLTVDSAEALGADSLIHGKLGAHSVVVRCDGHAKFDVGARLLVAPATDKHYYFETSSGTRI